MCLCVQRGLCGEHAAGLKIEKLSGNGRRTKIHRDTKARTRYELKRRLIRENWHFPLGEFQFHITCNQMPARQPPARGEFGGRQEISFLFANRQFTVKHFDAAAFAAPTATTRKFHTFGKQNILDARTV